VPSALARDMASSLPSRWIQTLGTASRSMRAYSASISVSGVSAPALKASCSAEMSRLPCMMSKVMVVLEVEAELDRLQR